MARKQARPGRTLVVFFMGLAIMYGLVALAGSWRPELGLDLQGGTRITLTAQGNPSSESLDEARQIIDNRVNGSGVAEAEVTTEGSNVIAVEIPGERRRDLIETVQRQAQLRFRLVTCTSPQNCFANAATATTPDAGAGAGQGDGNGTGQGDGTGQGNGTGNGQGTGNSGGASDGASESAGVNRVGPGFAQADGETESPSGSPSEEATEPTEGTTVTAPSEATPTDGTSGTPTEGASEDAEPVDAANAVATLDEALAYRTGGITQADIDLYNSYTCDADGNISKLPTAAADLPDVPADNPLDPLVACSIPEQTTAGGASQSFLYLLSPAVIAGTDVDDANAAIPQGEVSYVVQLNITGNGREVFADLSSQWAGTQNQFAIVLDGQVISAPNFQGAIPNGQAQISGTFTEAEANSLATSLRFGALPISFDEPSVETVGPSLAGDQLTAGLTAGAFGLGLVLLYCMLYYRGLGLVVVASLLAAAAVNYALVLLLSETAGFTLTLPGIAGLIIAVGVTADSFIIFFERIRDEMREGKSMRVAVETGWKRARVTRLAAQVVSLLSALILYIFATGAVKGFGFALGLTTIVDLAILFWFTKPMVSWLARFTFFNSGHKLSGLSRSTLGIDGDDVPAGVGVAGGKA